MPRKLQWQAINIYHSISVCVTNTMSMKSPCKSSGILNWRHVLCRSVRIYMRMERR